MKKTSSQGPFCFNISKDSFTKESYASLVTIPPKRAFTSNTGSHQHYFELKNLYIKKGIYQRFIFLFLHEMLLY